MRHSYCLMVFVCVVLLFPGEARAFGPTFDPPNSACRVRVRGFEKYSEWNGSRPSTSSVANALATIRTAVGIMKKTKWCRRHFYADLQSQIRAGQCEQRIWNQVDFTSLFHAIQVAGGSGSTKAATVLHDTFIEYDGPNWTLFRALSGLAWKHLVVDPVPTNEKVQWLAQNWCLHAPGSATDSVERYIGNIVFEELQCSLGAGRALRAVLSASSPTIQLIALGAITHYDGRSWSLSASAVPVVIDIAVKSNDPSVREGALRDLREVEMPGTKWLGHLDQIVQSSKTPSGRLAALLKALSTRMERKVMCGDKGCKIQVN